MNEVIQISVGNAAQSVSYELCGDFSVIYKPSALGRTFADEILRLPLRGRRLLDVGCGSGVISVAAALCGAHVTSTDINPLAVETTEKNAELNGVGVNGIVGDCLDNVKDRDFDIIVANCPLFAMHESNNQNTPVFNGEKGGRLFERLATEAGEYLSPTGVYITWLAPATYQEEREALLRRHWGKIEPVRKLQINTGTPADGGAYQGVEMDRMVAEGKMIEVGDRYFHKPTIYHLSQ